MFWQKVIKLSIKRWLLIQLDEPTQNYLETISRQQNQPPALLAAEMLKNCLLARQLAEGCLQQWQTLTPRQQQIAALICLNYTNRQIAARLGITPETVKTHIRHLLLQLGLHSKAELRQNMQEWDFSDWV